MGGARERCTVMTGRQWSETTAPMAGIATVCCIVRRARQLSCPRAPEGGIRREPCTARTGRPSSSPTGGASGGSKGSSSMRQLFERCDRYRASEDHAGDGVPSPDRGVCPSDGIHMPSFAPRGGFLRGEPPPAGVGASPLPARSIRPTPTNGTGWTNVWLSGLRRQDLNDACS